MNEVLAACGAFVFVYILQLHRIFKVLDRKPFNCEVCLAGWFSLILNLGSYWLTVPFKMSAAMVLAILITAIIKKV